MIRLIVLIAFTISNAIGCSVRSSQSQLGTVSTSGSTPTWSRCISADLSSSVIYCRSTVSCQAGEKKIPTSSFASQTACANYAAKAICYDSTTDTATGTCTDDYNCVSTSWTKVLLIGGLIDPQCKEYLPSWKRCIRYGVSGAICRPYEANCSMGEVQSPSTSNARIAGTLSARTTILQDCKDMTPYYGCFTQKSSATPDPAGNSNGWGWSCQKDTIQNCPSGIRVGLDVLFPSEAACQSYIPATWIKCKNDAIPEGTCMPYDPTTLQACPSGFTKKGNSGIFTSFSDCLVYNTYNLCYLPDTTLFLPCTSALCGSGFVQVAEFMNFSSCDSYHNTMQYNRCVNPTANVKTCVPSLAAKRGCPGTPNALTISPSILYNNQSACQAEDAYVLCYSSSANLLQCVQDWKGCDDLVPSNGYTQLTGLIPFLSKQACINYQPKTYYRCISFTTGVATCRPTNCLITEYANPANYSTQESCESVNMYIYCYTSATPDVSVANCSLDKIGCISPAVPLRSAATGLPVLYNYTGCMSYPTTGQWVRCVSSSSTVCRPQNSETTIDPATGTPTVSSCASGERVRTTTTGFTGLLTCQGGSKSPLPA